MVSLVVIICTLFLAYITGRLKDEIRWDVSKYPVFSKDQLESGYNNPFRKDRDKLRETIETKCGYLTGDIKRIDLSDEIKELVKDYLRAEIHTIILEENATLMLEANIAAINGQPIHKAHANYLDLSVSIDLEKIVSKTSELYKKWLSEEIPFLIGKDRDERLWLKELIIS